MTGASLCPNCGKGVTPGWFPEGLCAACLLTTALSGDHDDDVYDETSLSELDAGATLGPFRIVRLLGRGGMAAVYEAQDMRLERAVALKVLPPEFLHDDTFARRFAQEARVIAKLEHPNIVPIYASGIDDGIPWMSMRLLAGGNMGAVLERRRIEMRKAVEMLRQIAAALDYAHAHGVVHRDIKPTNILLDGSDAVLVGDFGLAQMLGAGHVLTRTGILAGTPHYMAPEQALGKMADRRSDVYSLGIVAYEMLAGTIPFTADSPIGVLMKHVNEPLPAPASAGGPPPWMSAVQTAAAKDPGDRWPSAGAFVAALEASLGSPFGGPAVVRAAAGSSDRRRSVAAWTGGAAAGTLVVASGLAWVILRERPLPPVPQPAIAAERSVNGTAPIAAPPSVPQETILPAGTITSSSAAVRRRETGAKAAVPPASDAHAPVASAPTLPVGVASSQVPSVQPAMSTSDVRGGADPEIRTPDVASPAAPVPDIITAPVRIRTVTPAYPDVARAAQLQGDVLLQGVVGLDGKVSEVDVLRPVHPLLDDAARRAVLLYEYTPGRRNGVPEPARIRITVSFRMR
jgi:TonB family protein